VPYDFLTRERVTDAIGTLFPGPAIHAAAG
jgi:hypothetical protein